MRRVLPCVSMFVALAGVARAQQPSDGTLPLAALCLREATAGSPTERTLLIAGALGATPRASTIRPLSRGDLDTAYAIARAVAVGGRGAARGRAAAGGDSAQGTGVAAFWRDCDDVAHSVWMRTWYNTAAANPDRDGAVWQGRGLTASLTAGVNRKWGPLAIALQPLAVFSENRPFAPLALRPMDAGDFRDPAWGGAIDLPYRFGTGAYARLEPGESYARLEWRSLSGGVSTQSQQWGPAYFYPLVMGTEAAAFPRAFVETQGQSVWIGDVSAVWEFGLLEASPFSGLEAGGHSRVASAFAASFRPRGISMLELGGARFFHVRRTPGAVAWRNATLVFTGVTKNQSGNVAAEFNQVASVFARVAPASSGLDVFAEYYREDHNADTRDLLLEPDHSAAFVVGLRRVWGGPDIVNALTIEHANPRISHLARIRGQSALYVHGTVTEGHSHRGQLLGSAAAFGAGGTVVAWSQVRRERSTDVVAELVRGPQNVEGGTWSGQTSGAIRAGVGITQMMRGRVLGATLTASLGYGLNRRGAIGIAMRGGL